MNREIVRCPYCEQIVPRTSWNTHNDLGDKYRIDFWCEPCQKSFIAEIVKDKTYSWTRDGYIIIKVPGIGWIKEHIYLWQKEHGQLPEGYVIHHINGVKTDNRLENLVAIAKKSHSPKLESTNKRNGLKGTPNPQPTKYLPQ